MEASQNKSDVTIQFLVGGLVIHSAGIFHLCFSVQNILACAMAKFFSIFEWQI
jgi:hypothetical protein